MFCMNCGKEIDDKAVICIHCGVATKNNSISNEKNWISTLLLCLFLGGIGAHRFYTGHTGSAIAQLLLALTIILSPIAALWAFIDLITIICGNFKTALGENLVK